MTMTLSVCISNTRKRLTEAGFSPAETSWMVRDIFAALKGYTHVDLITRCDDEITDWLASQVQSVVTRIASGTPVQYALGQTRWMGMTLKVTPAVLIPRPETEQLVDMAIADCGDTTDLRILDIGTGSGCIAIAMARALKFPIVTAIDISDEALAVAKENADTLKAKVDFKSVDILSATPVRGSCDIIISNPPYIAEQEKADMGANVLMHEPHTALFVPDDDPVKFYRAIARYARASLNPGGSLWLEINPLYAIVTRATVADAGFMSIDIIRDERGKQRFIHARQS